MKNDTFSIFGKKYYEFLTCRSSILSSTKSLGAIVFWNVKIISSFFLLSSSSSDKNALTLTLLLTIERVKTELSTFVKRIHKTSVRLRDLNTSLFRYYFTFLPSAVACACALQKSSGRKTLDFTKELVTFRNIPLDFSP